VGAPTVRAAVLFMREKELDVRKKEEREKKKKRTEKKRKKRKYMEKFSNMKFSENKR
jgi:hypothetical protein